MINPFKKRNVSVSIRVAASAKIHSAAKQAAPQETGGLLLGWWDKDLVVIEDIVIVEDAGATTHSWVRDETKAQSTLNRIRDTHPSAPIGYVGDWHCHPANVGASSRDIKSLKAASTQYKLPVVLIVRRPNNQLDFHAARKGKIRPVEAVKQFIS